LFYYGVNLCVKRFLRWGFLMSNIQLFNQDCMTAMASMKDKAFELAIVDPPYGIGNDSIHAGRLKKGSGKLKNRAIQLLDSKFDEIPLHENYFNELFRVSQNQIIWGMNYFTLPRTRGVICWDKIQPWKNFSQIELAWTSFDFPAKLFKYDNRTGDKIHPTQKPVALYQWLLKNYAKQGDRILDTHLGSGSSAIAADIMGYDFTGYEIDEDYYKAALDRFNRHKQQCVLEFA
jgi:site-specific DNA-methyltransferase (adenine-specific)